ncbi:MAG: VWA domain-containing protein, partial [Verrucomicrobiae bacterium]|nr:VWA domain-containing protein [Verrucomicrobiae bacterium]
MNNTFRLASFAATALCACFAVTASLAQAPLPEIRILSSPKSPDIALSFDGAFTDGQFLEQSCDLKNWSLLGVPTTNPFLVPKTRLPRYFRTSSEASDSGGTYFSVLRTLQLAMAESPDHLPRRASALVSRGGTIALYSFVRDEIANNPPADFGFPDTETLTAMRWGTRATLRCGAGTPREKCQLLLELLQEAGHEARLMQGAPDPLVIDLKTFVEWRPQRHLDSCVDLDVLAEGLDLPLNTPEDPDAVDASPEPILDQLMPLLDFESVGRAFDWSLPDAIPYVEVRLQDQWVALNPLVPSGQAGQSYTIGETRPLNSAPQIPRVTITVQAAPASDPHTLLTLINKSWPADALAGRQVTLSFPPVGDFLDVVQSEIRELQTFTPILSVVGSDLEGDQARALAAAGTPFSLSGELYAIDDASGTVRLGDSDLGNPEAQEGLVDQVAAIRIREIDATRFPLIHLSAEATATDGRSINGLGARAFTLFEDGTEQAITLQRNLRRDPSMIILLDASGSVSEAARAENRALATSVATGFLDHYADLNARVRVAAVSTRATFTGGWFSNPDTLPEQLLQAETQAFGSDLWKALADLLKEETPTVVLFVTDGQTTDTLTPDLLRNIQLPGVPVFTLGFGEVNESVLQEISDFTSGRFHVGSTVDTILASLQELVDREVETNYVLRYVASSAGSAERAVQLGFD